MLSPRSLTVAKLDTEGLDSFLDLELAKLHAGVDEADFDELVTLYLAAAIEAAENSMHRTIIPRAHRWVLDRFPTCNVRIELPRGKTQSVASIVYATANGGSATLTGPSASPPGTGFRQDLNDEDGGVIMPPVGEGWPIADSDAPAPVVINFTAGYLAAELPERLKHALLMQVTDAIDIKGTSDQSAAINASSAAFQFDNVLAPYRLSRWY